MVRFIWANSGQVPPKLVEETVCNDQDSLDSISSYRYSENSDTCNEELSCLDCSALLTIEDQSLERTSVVSTSILNSNMRQSLMNFKNRAATKIQRFVKTKKTKKITTSLIKALTNTSKKFCVRKSFCRIKLWPEIKNQAALAIQKAWRAYKLTNSSTVSSPRRQLLLKAVNIGNTIIKIQNVIDYITSKRPNSLASSPTKDKQSLLYKHPTILLRRKSNFSDTDSSETVASTPLLDVFVYKHSKSFTADWDCIKEGNIRGSLLMQKAVRVRTKKKKELGYQDILHAFELDFIQSEQLEYKFVDSCIPQLKPESLFFFNINHSETKQKLIFEYKDLIQS